MPEKNLSSKPPAIFLMGPTATGKTDLAITLYQTLPVELISVDSTLVYRGLDIGSGKPTQAQLEIAPHRLIDCCEPNKPYSAASFRKDALKEMEGIVNQGKIPLLVGGTMLYFKALQNGLSPLPEANAKIRKELEEEAKITGWPALHNKLKNLDPKAAARIEPQDKQRIARALEVFKVTGKPLSNHFEDLGDSAFPYQLTALALVPEETERKSLHDRIEMRFDNMLKKGLIEEVIGLKARGDCHLDLPAIRSVGYRQVWQYLDGVFGYQEMREQAIAATRQLAKRQLTWLRHWEGVYYFDYRGSSLKEEVISNLSKLF